MFVFQFVSVITFTVDYFCCDYCYFVFSMLYFSCKNWTYVVMSGRRIVPTQAVCNALTDTDILLQVSSLLRVFETSIGRRAHCKLVHNAVGGHVTVTSSTTRLLNCLPISSPVVQLVTSAVRQHCAVYKDGGGVCATLALLIVDNVLRLGVSQRPLVVDSLDTVLQLCIDYLKSDTCTFRVDLHVNNLSELLRIIRGVSSVFTCVLLTRCFTGYNLQIYNVMWS